MTSTTTIEHSHITEGGAHEIRQRLIDQGAAVSLVAYDSSRGLYVFDATPLTAEPAYLRKAHTAHTMHLRANYEERDVQAVITSGRGGIGLGVRYTHQVGAGVITNLTPAQAREMAAELIARADEIEGLSA